MARQLADRTPARAGCAARCRGGIRRRVFDRGVKRQRRCRAVAPAGGLVERRDAAGHRWPRHACRARHRCAHPRGRALPARRWPARPLRRRPRGDARCEGFRWRLAASLVASMAMRWRERGRASLRRSCGALGAASPAVDSRWWRTPRRRCARPRRPAAGSASRAELWACAWRAGRACASAAFDACERGSLVWAVLGSPCARCSASANASPPSPSAAGLAAGSLARCGGGATLGIVRVGNIVEALLLTGVGAARGISARQITEFGGGWRGVAARMGGHSDLVAVRLLAARRALLLLLGAPLDQFFHRGDAALVVAQVWRACSSRALASCTAARCCAMACSRRCMKPW